MSSVQSSTEPAGNVITTTRPTMSPATTRVGLSNTIQRDVRSRYSQARLGVNMPTFKTLRSPRRQSHSYSLRGRDSRLSFDIVEPANLYTVMRFHTAHTRASHTNLRRAHKGQSLHWEADCADDEAEGDTSAIRRRRIESCHRSQSRPWLNLRERARQKNRRTNSILSGLDALSLRPGTDDDAELADVDQESVLQEGSSDGQSTSSTKGFKSNV